MNKIRIGIIGYGNLAKGVESAVKNSPDMELTAVFSRRNPESITIATPNVNVYGMEKLESMTDAIDVLVLCGGSAKDLPEQTPKYAQLFNVVDSFDNHSKIPEHFENVNAAAKSGGKVATISVGWDPGLFSLNRAVATAVLPKGENYTFWGKGVSQGHSDAIRRIEGVKDARQYTIPVESALEQVRSGSNPTLTTRQKHTRECFVVIGEDGNKAKIEEEIKTMPAYFAEYDTTVHFISEEELQKDHRGIPHGGFMIRSGKTGWNEEHKHIYEFKLTLESNPEFTSSVLVAYARATYRMNKEGMSGCKTIFDIPVSYISTMTPEEMRKNML
ncbi:MAG: diaminopimelate dehydrogenase [Anaerovorax sp.]